MLNSELFCGQPQGLSLQAAVKMIVFYFQSSVTASPCHLLCQRRLILPWLSVCIISRNAEDGVPYRSGIFTVKFVMRINDKNISVQSRAGACSRRKITSFLRRLVGKPPYICFNAKITDFIFNPPSRLTPCRLLCQRRLISTVSFWRDPL